MNNLPAYCKVTATSASGAATVETGHVEKRYGDGYERVFREGQINNLSTTVSLTLAPLSATNTINLQTFIDENVVFGWTHPLYKPTQWSCESISIKGERTTSMVTLELKSRYGVYP